MKKEFLAVKREELLARTREFASQGARLSVISGADLGATVEALYTFDFPDHVTTLRVAIPSSDKKVPSITPVVPAANLYEREFSEMFGVELIGHPSPGRLFLSDDYKGEPPLLKKTGSEPAKK